MLECTVETYIISFRAAAQFELLTMRHQESLTEQIEFRLWDTPRLILRGRRDKAVAGRRAAGGVLVLKETVPLSAAAGRTRVQQLKPDVTPRDPAQILLLKRNCVFCPCGYIYIRFNGFPQEQKKGQWTLCSNLATNKDSCRARLWAQTIPLSFHSLHLFLWVS